MLLCALLLAGVGCQPDASPTDTTGAPVVEVASAEAIVNDLDAVPARAVVLNVWATWCLPCKAEFPDLVQFDAEREADGVEVRFVSVDDAAAVPAVRTFLAEHGVTEPSYLYTGDADLAQQFDPFLGYAVPTTIVLDADGIVQASHVGVLSRAEMDALVDPVLADG